MYKILNINNYHYPRGGSDSYFLQLTQLLKSEGHLVSTFSSSKGRVTNPEWMLVEPPKGVDTESPVGISNLWNFLYSVDAKNKLCAAIEQFKPDIAHLHIYYGQLTSSILSALSKYDIPIVQTLHEFKLVCPTQGLYAHGNYCDDCKGKDYWHAALKKCNRGSFSRSVLSMSESYLADYLGARSKVNKFIAVSEFQRSRLLALGVDERKLTVLSHFSDIKVPCNGVRGNYFLFVGRIHADKGVATLLKAYSLLQEKNIPLKIVGEGGDANYWQAYSTELGIADSVEWLGHREGQDLDSLYNGCLALLNPSLLNETFGLTCLEALARGKPVIASRVGAFPEIVTDTEDGILVTPGDPKELASAMEKFQKGIFDSSAMGLKGYHKVNTKFDRKTHYDRLLEIYRTVLNE